MRAFSISASGDYKKTKRFLDAAKSKKIREVLDVYAPKGLDMLSRATPVRSGLTASSWSYREIDRGDSVSLEYYNSNLSNDGSVPVVILIVYGHGTRTGGYVAPNDFVSPVLDDFFREVSDAVSKAVDSL